MTGSEILVSQEDLNKAVKSAKASATRAANKGKSTGKRRKKTYRLQRPDKQAKRAIAKFQHKHPYISAVVGVGGTVAALDGALQYMGKSNQAFLYEAGLLPASIYRNKAYRVPYGMGRALSKFLRGFL